MLNANAAITDGTPGVSEPNAEAEYQLESPVRCPSCQAQISTLRVVRLLRLQVNFTSTLPRRGRSMICPACSVILSAELGTFS